MTQNAGINTENSGLVTQIDYIFLCNGPANICFQVKWHWEGRFQVMTLSLLY